MADPRIETIFSSMADMQDKIGQMLRLVHEISRDQANGTGPATVPTSVPVQPSPRRTTLPASVPGTGPTGRSVSYPTDVEPEDFESDTESYDSEWTTSDQYKPDPNTTSPPSAPYVEVMGDRGWIQYPAADSATLLAELKWKNDQPIPIVGQNGTTYTISLPHMTQRNTTTHVIRPIRIWDGTQFIDQTTGSGIPIPTTCAVSGAAAAPAPASTTPALTKTVQVQTGAGSMTDPHKWTTYPESTQLFAVFAAKLNSLTITGPSGQPLAVDFKSMMQTNSTTGYQRPIRVFDENGTMHTTCPY